MNTPAKSATKPPRNHLFSPKYIKVQFGGEVPHNYHPFWVTPKFITRVTGWDKYVLRSARDRGFINYREDDRGELLYDYNSLPEKMLKKHA